MAVAKQALALCLCAVLALSPVLADRKSLEAAQAAEAHRALVKQVEAMGGLKQRTLTGAPEVRGLKGVSRQLLQHMLELAESQFEGNLQRRTQRLGDAGVDSLSVGDFEAVMLVPTYSCPVPARMGRWGEHGDWVCLSHFGSGKRDALALSFGSGCETSFERDLYEHLDIRTNVYDFDLSARTVDELSALRFVSFRNAGLTGSSKLASKRYRFPSVNWVTLPKAIQDSGVAFADIVKIDCEGCEIDVVKDLAAMSNRTHPAVGQVLVQVHDVSEWKLPKVRTLFQTLEGLGFRLFHAEVNPYYKMHYEVAFIHENLVKPRESAM